MLGLANFIFSQHLYLTPNFYIHRRTVYIPSSRSGEPSEQATVVKKRATVQHCNFLVPCILKTKLLHTVFVSRVSLPFILQQDSKIYRDDLQVCSPPTTRPEDDTVQ
jgi:hypothetical protein